MATYLQEVVVYTENMVYTLQPTKHPEKSEPSDIWIILSGQNLSLITAIQPCWVSFQIAFQQEQGGNK